ncbi:hypothetical protein ACLMAB_01340 [Brevibacillus laterosporus]
MDQKALDEITVLLEIREETKEEQKQGQLKKNWDWTRQIYLRSCLPKKKKRNRNR